MVSTRTLNTTLMRLSTNDEHADVRDNVVYTTADGPHLALLDSSGVMELRDCWLRAGWVVSHGSFDGTFVDSGGNLEGEDPGFADPASQEFSPAPGSPLIDKACILPNVNDDFTGAGPDIGPYEFGIPLPCYGPRPIVPGSGTRK